MIFACRNKEGCWCRRERESLWPPLCYSTLSFSPVPSRKTHDFQAMGQWPILREAQNQCPFQYVQCIDGVNQSIVQIVSQGYEDFHLIHPHCAGKEFVTYSGHRSQREEREVQNCQACYFCVPARSSTVNNWKKRFTLVDILRLFTSWKPTLVARYHTYLSIFQHGCLPAPVLAALSRGSAHCGVAADIAKPSRDDKSSSSRAAKPSSSRAAKPPYLSAPPSPSRIQHSRGRSHRDQRICPQTWLRGLGASHEQCETNKNQRENQSHSLSMLWPRLFPTSAARQRPKVEAAETQTFASSKLSITDRASTSKRPVGSYLRERTAQSWAHTSISSYCSPKARGSHKGTWDSTAYWGWIVWPCCSCRYAENRSGLLSPCARYWHVPAQASWKTSCWSIVFWLDILFRKPKTTANSTKAKEESERDIPKAPHLVAWSWNALSVSWTRGHLETNMLAVELLHLF